MRLWYDRVRAGITPRRFWSALLGMLFLSGLCGYLLVRLLRDDLFDPRGPVFVTLLGRIGPGMFVITSLIYALILMMAVAGWGWIVGSLSGNWQWWQHGRIYCVTAVTRRIPGMLWYLVGRVVLYERLAVPRTLTTVASGLEFATILLGGFLVAIITWPVALSQYDLIPGWFIVGLLCGGALLNPLTLRRVVRRIHPQHTPLELRYRHLCGWVVLYAGVWIGGGGLLFVLAHTIHPLPLSMVPVMIGIWATAGVVATLLSFVPLGLGQELTLTALLSPFVGTPEAIVIAFLMRGVLTVNEVVWALLAGLLGLEGVSRYLRWGPQGRLEPASHTGAPDAQKPKEVYDQASVLPHK